MPTTTKLFSETFTAFTNIIDHRLMIPYIRDNTLYAVVGRADAIAFVNLNTGAYTYVRDTNFYNLLGGCAWYTTHLLGQPIVKDEEMLCTFAYETGADQIAGYVRARDSVFNLNDQTVSSNASTLYSEQISATFRWNWGISAVLDDVICYAQHGQNGHLFFGDLIDGATTDLDLSGTLGTAYSLMPSQKLIQNRNRQYMIIGKYLAGNIHYAVRLDDGDVTNLASTGGGSPQPYILTPLRTAKKYLIPLTSDTVVTSANSLKWYDQNFSLAGTTTLTSGTGALTYPNPRCGAVLGTDDDGNIYVLMSITNKTGEASEPQYVRIYRISGLDYSVQNCWTLASGSGYGDLNWVSGWGEWFGTPSLPIVDATNNMLYALHLRIASDLTSYTCEMLKVDISDLPITSWNSYLWLVKQSSPYRVVQPVFWDEFKQAKKEVKKL